MIPLVSGATEQDAWLRVLSMLGAMALVAASGWLARRRGILDDASTRSMGRLAVDMAFPALTFTQMLRSLTPAALHGVAASLVLGLLMLATAAAAAGLAVRLAGKLTSRPTFVFLAAIPNWIFLPLPIAEALHGEAGVRVVLAVNIVAQLWLWTAGVALLRGGVRGAHRVRELAANLGLWATFGGALLALTLPSAAGWEAEVSPAGSLVRALSMLGSLTVPLSLLVVGSQLAAAPVRVPSPRTLGTLLATRLLVAPLATFGLVALVDAFIVPVDPEVRRVVCLIATMPVAVSCGLFIERFGGDGDLGARAITLSTLAAMASVPVLFALLP